MCIHFRIPHLFLSELVSLADGELYSGTSADFMGRDFAIFRTLGDQHPIRTEQHDSRWLNGNQTKKNLLQKESISHHRFLGLFKGSCVFVILIWFCYWKDFAQFPSSKSGIIQRNTNPNQRIINGHLLPQYSVQYKVELSPIKGSVVEKIRPSFYWKILKHQVPS